MVPIPRASHEFYSGWPEPDELPSYQVLYLVIMETVNWICDIGVIYEPLIIRYSGIPNPFNLLLMLIVGYASYPGGTFNFTS